VNRLRLRTNSDRFRHELAETPAIYIVFDMLAGRESLLEQPFRLRRETLERFFRTAKPPSPPIYLSASTGDLKTVETKASTCRMRTLPISCSRSPCF